MNCPGESYKSTLLLWAGVREVTSGDVVASRVSQLISSPLVYISAATVQSYLIMMARFVLCGLIVGPDNPPTFPECCQKDSHNRHPSLRLQSRHNLFS
jgi:hypothetical protein